MNSFFAAGLFDSPWIVAVILIVSALANWMAKRRQEKQAEQPPEGDEPSPASGNPPGEFNLEETLRRLMGEEPRAPVPAPPPIPNATQGGLPPVPEWQDEEPFRPVTQSFPASRPPPIAAAQASITTAAASEQLAQAVRRFEQLNEQARHPATVISHVRVNRASAASRTASRWRDPRSARQAFVASMVFAPPKSMEP